MAFAGGRGNDFEESQTAANQQTVTLDQFLALLNLTTKHLLNEIRKEWRLSPKKDTFDDTVLQNLNETVYPNEKLNTEDEIVYSKEKLNAEETTLEEFVESLESGREDFPYEKESFQNLKLFDLKVTFPELFTQQKGTFKIKKRIENGTLQFLYKNGLLNLLKECYVAFKECDIVDIQYQTENQDFLLINAAGGIKLRKKVKKKKKRKREKEE